MRTERHNVQRIQTPEGIVFHMPLAGLTSRFLARLLDWIVINMLMFAVILIGSLLGAFGALVGTIGMDFVMATVMLGFFLASLGYNIVCEYLWNGQTVGKKAFRLRVIDEFGLRLQFNQVVIRNLLRTVDFLPGGYQLGAIALFLSPRNQRLGDLAAGTIVVRKEKQSQPDLAALFADKFNSFRQYPHLAAKLRQQVSALEAQLALEALLRRDQLVSDARARVFHEFAERFRQRVSFPEDTTLGLSDEKYVRNVIDIVLRVRDDHAVGQDDG